MHSISTAPTEVFSPGEIARAAGADVKNVRDLFATGAIPSGSPGLAYAGYADALAAARLLQVGGAGNRFAAGLAPRPDIFAHRAGAAGASRTVPLLVSSTMHSLVIAAAVVVTTLGLVPGAASSLDAIVEPEAARLVFLALPGPGGGGGGGGRRQAAPPPRAERQGQRTLSSPLPARVPPKLPVPVPEPEPPEPAVLEAEVLPPIVAPVVVSGVDPEDRAGVLEASTAEADSRGPGEGGGVGSGQGTGIGEGDGSGIGPGSGGGIGGGPYRPGSGVQPPRLLREVKPDYTEEARRQGIEGEVVLEIVVRRDGTVGDTRLIQGLGAGLDQRAVQAVRQWRFAPARRLETPVDVIVEVAVEFRLR